jgi:hypothetical protein
MMIAVVVTLAATPALPGLGTVFSYMISLDPPFMDIEKFQLPEFN